MPQILLINPTGHGAYKKKARKRKSARRSKRSPSTGDKAMKKARKARKSKARKPKARKVRRVHRARKARRKVKARRSSSKTRRKAIGYTVGSAPIRRRKMNPIRKHRRHARRHRNPIGGMFNKIPGMNLIGSAAMGAGGAVLLDLAWAKAPIPATWKTGNLQYVTKIVGAVGLTWALGLVVKKQTAEAAGVGMITVILHSLARDILAAQAPSLMLGDLGYYSPGQVSLGAYDMNNTASLGDLGEYNDMHADNMRM